MKHITRLLVFAAVSLASTGFSQVLLTDDFNGATINSSKWTVSLPYADSSVAETSGYLQVRNRGRIASVLPFAGSYSVSGNLMLSNNQFSNSKVVLRTDGSSLGAAEMPGVAVQFQVREDGAVQNQISIYTIGASGGQSAATNLTTPLALGTWYAFSIVDDGASVRLFFDGSSTPTLSLTTAYSAGGLMGFYNREGSAAGSSISNNGNGRLDSITVSAIPEPSTYAVWVGVTTLLLALCRQKRRANIGASANAG